jgi:DNA-binding MarR family transcriptional regulator
MKINSEAAFLADDADQAVAIVQDFVQIWIKFDAMLHHELAQGRDSLKDLGMGQEAGSGSLELFYRVGSVMWQCDSLTMGELSHALSVPLSTATRMVDSLVVEGYVLRLPDPGDRRVVRVALSPGGCQLHQAMRKYIAERVGYMLSRLSRREQEELFSLIHKVSTALAREAG